MTQAAVATDSKLKNQSEQTKSSFKAITLLPLAALIVTISVHLLIPNKQSFTTDKYYPALLEIFLVFNVAIPAASQMIFVGLFMGMG